MKIWTTKEGRVLNISEMEDSHLINVYKMLKNKNFIEDRVWKAYSYTPCFLGEASLEAFEQESLYILDKKPCAQMTWIKDEIDKRGLNIS